MIKTPKVSDGNSFKGASGKIYTIEPPELLGIERRRTFDGVMTRAAFGQGTKGLIASILAMKKAFNKSELAEVGHQITTHLSITTKIHERSDATLEACCLFINTADEDRTIPPTDAQVADKIKDWNDAGIPYAFFVNCAGTFNDTLKALYEAGSPSSPGAEVKKGAEVSSTTST